MNKYAVTCECDIKTIVLTDDCRCKNESEASAARISNKRQFEAKFVPKDNMKNFWVNVEVNIHDKSFLRRPYVAPFRRLVELKQSPPPNKSEYQETINELGRKLMQDRKKTKKGPVKLC